MHLFIQWLTQNNKVKKLESGEPFTVGHLLSEEHHFCDEETMKNEEKT